MLKCFRNFSLNMIMLYLQVKSCSSVLRGRIGCEAKNASAAHGVRIIDRTAL